MSAEPKNSAISRDSGAPPEMKSFSRPPVRSLILEKTSRSAMASFNARSGPGLRFATRASKPARPTEEALPPFRVLRDLLVHAAVHLLVEPRHRRHDLRLDLDHVVGHALDAL